MYKILSDKSSPIVHKYGGTSVGSTDRMRAVAKRVSKTKASGYNKVAVVVSAMAGETNRLVELVKQVNGNASASLYDMAVSAGEQVSIALLSAALEDCGEKAKPFLAYQLGILTDPLHSKARIKSIQIEKLHQCWHRGEIPVIAGFQGVTTDGEITTLGRGGTDTSAVALAVALDAKFCEINTDVDGVYSADPRYVSGTHLLKSLDYEVALEMASLGSKVLHPRCVELAAKYNMPVVVRSSFNGDENQRTIIMDYNQDQDLEGAAVSGISVDQNVTKMTVENIPTNSTFIADLFARIAECNVNVDIIVHNRMLDATHMRLGFTFESQDLAATKDVVEEFKRTETFQQISYEADSKLVKISAVGVGMRSHPGVASQVFSTLAAEGISIHMISTSEIKISCVIDERHKEKGAQALHNAFFRAENPDS